MPFSFYTPIVIDHTKCGSNDSSAFPVLVSSTDNRFKTTGNGGHVQNSSGFDLRFYSDAVLSTPLSYQLEKYDGTAGQVIMWVKVPTVSHSLDTTIYLAYGDSSLTTDGSSSATWSSFKAVYHMGDGTTISAADATGNFNGTNHGCTATAGQIYGAAQHVATPLYIDMGSTGLTDPHSPWSISAWINPTDATHDYVFVFFGENTANSGFLAQVAASHYEVGSWNGTSITGGTSAAGTWAHVVGTYDGANLNLYVNGSLVAGPTASSIATPPDYQQYIGCAVNGNSPAAGKTDEVRIAASALSADWVLTSYNNQNSPGTFYSLSAEQTPGGGGAGTTNAPSGGFFAF